MAGLKQGTTYPIIITIPGVDLTGAGWVIVSLKPDRKPAIEFNRDQADISVDESGTTIIVALTEAQSVGISPGGVTVDVNWLLDGVRGGCIPASINITDTLLKRVVGE